MLRLFGFAPAEAPCKENAAAKKTQAVVDVEEPARKSLAELDAERHADCQRMSQLWALIASYAGTAQASSGPLQCPLQQA